jgi:predicted enzyme related to lactoylglutathione lyase
VRLRVPDLEEGLRFYRVQLDHKLARRHGSAEAGLRMSHSETELVLFTETACAAGGSPEVDLLVNSTDIAVGRLQELGWRVVSEPFDIPVGRCAVVADRFGYKRVILDLSKGLLKTDADGNALG